MSVKQSIKKDLRKMDRYSPGPVFYELVMKKSEKFRRCLLGLMTLILVSNHQGIAQELKMDALNRREINSKDTIYRFYAIVPPRKMDYKSNKQYYGFTKDTIMLTQGAVADRILHGSKYIYIVRHAEKLDNTPYAALSPTGHQRASILKDSLEGKKIGIIFATYFQRTQETARPLADAIHKSLLIYRNSAIDSIVRALKDIKNKNILLVGHSGNLPSIIEGLTGKKVNAIQEHEYDNLYIIKRKKEKTELIQQKYGAPTTREQSGR